MKIMTISDQGKNAEKLFKESVSVAVRGEKSKKGDLRVVIGENVHYVEVKSTASRKGQINQVRPIKYLILAIYSPARDKPWVVVPPHKVVEMATQKSRGQHCENPLECAQFSLGDWADEFSCTPDELENEVIKAIKSGEEKKEVKKLLEELKNDNRRHCRMQKLITQAVLKGEELDL